ncbi:3237_t:CDS:2 [Diversispora eburnea]|uniref:3237_t:CDS:1 n=1 Tax=Diversispora eburnea TaxID=1213867 RepID=A0A9N9F066_9GLOM|nr:3237_t:CDS:2 [Diversispora eburnea]
MLVVNTEVEPDDESRFSQLKDPEMVNQNVQIEIPSIRVVGEIWKVNVWLVHK